MPKIMPSMQSSPAVRRFASVLLSAFLLGQMTYPALAAQPGMLSGDVRVTVSPTNLQETIPIAGASRKVTMAFHGVAIQDVLRALSKKGNFNVLIDESVDGFVSMDLNNVTIQDALETLKTSNRLAYSVQGNSLMVADAESPKGQTYRKAVTRMIPLRYANARTIANFLNQTVFAGRSASAAGSVGSSGGAAAGSGGGGLPVTPDFHTNSLLVVGTSADIKLVQEHVEALDVPREMKTWRLSQANALDVATILSSSLFNEGQPPILTGSGGSGGGGASGSDTSPSSMRVMAENIAEGTGTSQATQSGGSSSGGGSGSTSVVNNVTLRAKVKENQTIQISPNGPIIMPDTRLNTVTLLGTAEQIAMAEALIPTLDRKVPQVILEASLIEVSEEGRKEMLYSAAGNGSRFSSGVNNSPTSTRLANRIFSTAIGRSTSNGTPLESLYRFTTASSSGLREFAYQLNGLVSKSKAKILANPTAITSSDNETIISIVDEIIRSITVTQGMGAPPSATVNIGEAGIVLNILPRVGADGTVSLRVRPVVSTVASQREDAFNNVVTLLSKRELLAQNVILQDGETLVLGGLIHDTSSSSVTKSPMLSRLPIVGALARSTASGKSRSELIIMITPHIIDDESQLANSKSGLRGSQLIPGAQAQPASGEFETEPGMVPVSMTEKPARRMALPPLGPAHPLGNDSFAPAGEAKEAPLFKPSPRPTSVLLPKADEGVIPVSNSSPPAPRRVEKRVPERREMPAVASPLPDRNISDEDIRVIMEKFK